MPKPVPGADPTGVADSTAALQAFLNPSDRGPIDPFGDDAIPITIAPGKYRVTAPLRIHRTITLFGYGVQIFSDTPPFTDLLVIEATAPSTLLVGIRFIYRTGSPSLIDNLCTGVRPKCFNFQMRDCKVDGAGYGLPLDTLDDTLNLNWPYLDNVSITNCRHAGVSTRGTDVSAGTFIGVRVLNVQNHFNSTNGLGAGIAIEDSSANGNTYVGCNAETADINWRFANVGGPNPTVLLGCYAESAEPIEWVGNYSGNTTVIGGILGRRHDVKGDRVGASMSRLKFRSVSSAGIAYTVAIPGDDQNSALWFAGNDSAAETWLLKRQQSGVTFDWAWQHYLKQGTNVSGLHARDLGGGAWEVGTI